MKIVGVCEKGNSMKRKRASHTSKCGLMMRKLLARKWQNGSGTHLENRTQQCQCKRYGRMLYVNCCTQCLLSNKTSVVSVFISSLQPFMIRAHTFVQAKLLIFRFLSLFRCHSQFTRTLCAPIRLFACHVSHFVYIKYNNMLGPSTRATNTRTQLFIFWPDERWNDVDNRLSWTAKRTATLICARIVVQFNCAALFISIKVPRISMAKTRNCVRDNAPKIITLSKWMVYTKIYRYT